MAVYNIKLVVREIPDGYYENAAQLEDALSDILHRAVGPALQIELLSSFTKVTKARTNY